MAANIRKKGNYEYLCFITGENICIDGGMTRQMIYHGDNGWTLGVKTDKD